MQDSDMNQKLLVIGNIVPDIEKITLFKKCNKGLEHTAPNTFQYFFLLELD